MRQCKRQRIAATKLLKKPKGKFFEIDNPKPYDKAYKNNRYVVMIDNNIPSPLGGKLTRAMIQQHDDNPIHNHWSELQAIKNELFGNETLAVEFYPKESKLINDHNIYWLWIVDEPF